MTDTITPAIVAARKAYEQTRSGCRPLWTGADWTHESDTHTIDDPAYCEGGRSADCATCLTAERDAWSAAASATEAIGAAERGDWEHAMFYARDAASRERTHGDDPIYGPFAAAITAARL